MSVFLIFLLKLIYIFIIFEGIKSNVKMMELSWYQNE